MKQLLLSLFVATALFATSPLWAAEKNPTRWGLGLEALWESYREETSTIASTANPRSTRLAAWVEGKIGRCPARFELHLPWTESGTQEAWYSGGTQIQLNELDQKRRDIRLQVDPFPRAPQLWVGFRREDVRQRRWAFNVPATFDLAEEFIRSWWLEFGWRLPLGPSKADGSWKASRSRLGLSFGMPLKVETTNTVLPGFAAEDVDGMRLSFTAELLRQRDRKLRLAWSYLRWNGSDWQAYGGGIARWPRNETRSISVQAQFRF